MSRCQADIKLNQVYSESTLINESTGVKRTSRSFSLRHSACVRHFPSYGVCSQSSWGYNAKVSRKQAHSMPAAPPRHEPGRDTTFFPTEPRQAFWIFLTMCSRQLLPSARTGIWNGSLKRNKIPERIFQILNGEVGGADSSCYRNREEEEADHHRLRSPWHPFGQGGAGLHHNFGGLLALLLLWAPSSIKVKNNILYFITVLV